MPYQPFQSHLLVFLLLSNQYTVSIKTTAPVEANKDVFHVAPPPPARRVWQGKITVWNGPKTAFILVVCFILAS